MRELGLGHGVVLPSDPGLSGLFTSTVSRPWKRLTRIIGKEATPEDLAVAQAAAQKNVNYDTLIKETLAAGKANYGDQIKQQLENEYSGKTGRRMAGEGLAVLLAGVGGGLTADLLESDLIQIQDPNNYQASY